MLGPGTFTFWLPLMIFAFLFGLSMDYEVFILARMREEYDRTGQTDSSVVDGLGRTGRRHASDATLRPVYVRLLLDGSSARAAVSSLPRSSATCPSREVSRRRTDC